MLMSQKTDKKEVQLLAAAGISGVSVIASAVIILMIYSLGIFSFWISVAIVAGGWIISGLAYFVGASILQSKIKRNLNVNFAAALIVGYVGLLFLWSCWHEYKNAEED